jgi:acyl dehydratase
MSLQRFDTVAVGDELPPLELPPVSRTTLALYACASGDHNPMHLDIDVARGVGLPDVFAHGMLVMAYAGRLLTDWVPQERLREFKVRFVAVTQVRARLTCRGKVEQIREEGGQRLAGVGLQVADETGEVKVRGSATVAL